MSQDTGNQEANLTPVFHRLVSKLDDDPFQMNLAVLEVPRACHDDLKGRIVSSFSGSQKQFLFPVAEAHLALRETQVLAVRDVGEPEK